jgi:Mlc titration factor MtfA (ptsG expression regulator)
MHEHRLGNEHRSTLRHEMAHAWEDTYNIKKRRTGHGISVELWYKFSETRKGFVSRYAASKPAEFFAESVEAFYSKSRRELLQRIDPQTFEWLEREL